MPLIRSASIQLRSLHITRTLQVQPLRTFTHAPRLAIKEDSSRSPEELERAKQQQKVKAEEGKGEWHRETASASEESVAADRNHQGKSLGEMQKQTAQESQEEHPHGKK